MQIIVSIAAIALGQYWALGLGLQAVTFGYATVSGLAGLRVTAVGNLLITALVPPQEPVEEIPRVSAA